jgi:quercetin 2,3-dioxygenase
MINLCRSQQRYEDCRAQRAIWHTFSARASDGPLSEGFGALESFDEIRLPPNGFVKLSHYHLSETITYVLMGAVAFEDTLGRAGMLQAGEVRCVTAERGVHVTETNAAHDDWTHLFQIGLRTAEGFAPTEEQKRFTMAERRDQLCLIAAGDAHQGALRMRQDACVYSAMLQSGQHLVHDLRAQRRAWLHVVSGEVKLGDLILSAGDSAGASAERCVSFTARARSEVLLVDLA